MHKVLNEKDDWARLEEVVYCGINSRAEKALYLVATTAVMRKCGRFIPRNYTRGSCIPRVSDWLTLLYAVSLQLMYWQVRFTHFRGKSDVLSLANSDELLGHVAWSSEIEATAHALQRKLQEKEGFIRNVSIIGYLIVKVHRNQLAYTIYAQHPVGPAASIEERLVSFSSI